MNDLTYRGFQQKGYVITEKEVSALEALILAQYKEAEKLINAELAQLFASMGNIKPENRFNWLIQYDRSIKLKKQILAIYSKYDKAAQGYTIAAGRIAMANNYYRQFYSLEWAEPGMSFAVLPENLIEYAVTGQVEAWNALTKAVRAKYLSSGYWPPAGTLSDIMGKNRADAILKIQQQINAGIMVGESYAQIARRVGSVIGQVSNGEASGQLANALRTVRTEGNRLLNAGALARTLEAESQGVKIEKEWDATFDIGTRPAHGAADKQRRPPDRPFDVGGEALMFPGDSAGSPSNTIHCRCSMIDVVEGISPSAKRGKNPITGESEIFEYTSFQQWTEQKGLVRNKFGELYRPQST